MKTLIVTATPMEVKKQLKNGEMPNIGELAETIHANKADLLISGVGLLSTSYYLTDILATGDYDLIINAGICGAFNDDLKSGQVLHIVKERIGDLGVEDRNEFKDVYEIGLSSPFQFPFENAWLDNSSFPENENIESLRKVSSLSMNMVSGNADTIDKLKRKYNADVENMEGAAVFFACMNKGIPFYEIRAVSNYVQERNKDNWEIDKAVEELNAFISKLISEWDG